MTFAAAGPETSILERAAELSALGDACDAGGRLVLLAGEAGVGKTSLLRRFCASRDGARILWGDCDALFTLSALGPLTDIAGVTGGELADVVDAGRPPLEVAAALLGELARPAIVVFEDVHWADEATLDVLRLLGRRVATVPALVVASYRDDELDRAHPLRIMLGELSRSAATERLRLAPLSERAVAELAEPHRVDARQLYRRTAGNPFFVTEALAAGGEQLPETVRDAVLARVTPLSPHARKVLDAAAIVPGTVELELLETLVGDAVTRLEECLSCGVLAAVSTGVAFRHDLARLAIEETLSPDRRRVLHRRALAALDGSAAPARLAYHAEGAGDGDAVLRFAPAAAERAASSGAHREAAAQYARALRFAGELGPAARAELLERRAQECFVTDQSGEAISDLQQALACRRQLGDRRAEGDLLRSLSGILWCPGHLEEAQRAGEHAVALLEPLGDGPELAMAYANMASLAMNREDARGVAGWGERALAFADEAITIHALNSTGTMAFLQSGASARGAAEQSLSLALASDRSDDVLRAYANLAWAAVRTREYALAERYLDEAIAYASDPEFDLWWIYLLGHRARVELDRGRWEQAAETATLIIRSEWSSSMPVVLALTVVGRLRARRGDPDPWAPLDEALALTRPELQRIEPVAVARAEAAWLAGERSRVAAETEHALALARRCEAPWVIGELACWRRRAGIEEPLEADVAEPFALELAGAHERAAGRWQELGCPYEAALALAGADAEPLLRRAFDELRALGASAAAAVVARRLRERGAAGLPRGPRPATRSNPALLTARELEVLALVTDGLRNRDIAERLFLAPKTVDHHVSAILRKLGTRTRGQAAVRALQLGLAQHR